MRQGLGQRECCGVAESQRKEAWNNGHMVYSLGRALSAGMNIKMSLSSQAIADLSLPLFSGLRIIFFFFFNNSTIMIIVLFIFLESAK